MSGGDAEGGPNTGSTKFARKDMYFKKLNEYLVTYRKAIVVHADNVGSHQMQQIRIALRGKAVLLMGKNTMMRKAVRTHMASNGKLEKLLPAIVGNIGVVFTNDDLSAVRDVIINNRRPAPAKAGSIAPIDVVIPKGQTQLEPTQTSFLQVLGIASKITKSKIEILSDVFLVKKGEKVGSSEAVLLQKLNINPFSYGLELRSIYDDGTVYSPDILSISKQSIIDLFMSGVANIASISLEVGYPTVASVPHSIANGLKNIIAIAIEADIDVPQAAKVKAYLANPNAFAAAAPAGGSSSGGGGGGGKPVEAAPAEEEGDMGMSLFGD